MITAKPNEPMSELAQVLSTRKPTYFEYRVEDLIGCPIVGPNGKPIETVKVRLGRKAEQDRALVEAHKYVRKMTIETPHAAADPDILDDAKSACIIATVFRDTDAPDAMPAFPTGEWVMRNMTTFQIGRFVNAYADVLRRTGEVRSDVDDGAVEALASISAHLEPERAFSALLGATREYLAECLILVSRKLDQSRGDLDAALARLDELDPPKAEAEAETAAPVADV
jgi:hypothetical protein